MATTTLILTQAAVAVSAASGVLEAGKKRFDLFGMLLISFAAALGGGSIRDGDFLSRTLDPGVTPGILATGCGWSRNVYHRRNKCRTQSIRTVVRRQFHGSDHGRHGWCVT